MEKEKIIISLLIIWGGLLLIAWCIVVLAEWFKFRFLGTSISLRMASRALGISKRKAREQFEAVLCEAERNCATYPTKFKPAYPIRKISEIGMAVSKKTRTIAYAPFWAYLVVVKPRLWKIAFMQTVGHEWNHNFDPYKRQGFLFRKRSEKKFYYWLCEVVNDFRGVEFVQHHYPKYERSTVISAVEAKANYYEHF